MTRCFATSTILVLAGTIVIHAQTSTAATVTPAAFAKLKWIEGKWRGDAINGTERPPFYERYRFIDDSTLVFGMYADSSFSRVIGTNPYELRNGRLTNAGQGPRWIAVRLDATTAVLAPFERAENWIIWQFENTNQWTASLEWKAPEGVTRKDFRMSRVR